MSAIKSGGTLYQYGALEPSGLSSRDFIFLNKSVKGWWLSNYFAETDPKEWVNLRKQITDDYDLNNGNIFETHYKESFALREIEKAIQVYGSSSGKILIKPWI